MALGRRLSQRRWNTRGNWQRSLRSLASAKMPSFRTEIAPIDVNAPRDHRQLSLASAVR